MNRTNAFVAAVLAAVVLTSCHVRQSSYSSSSYEVQAIHSLLVLPRSASRFDIQIAARVSQHLQDAGIQLTGLSKLDPMPQITAVDACRQAEQLDYQAVVFVDWNSLLMVECKSHVTRFTRVGSDVNAPGIDNFTADLIKYLQRKPRAN